MTNKIVKISTALALVLSVAACGGGGSSSNDDAPAPTGGENGGGSGGENGGGSGGENGGGTANEAVSNGDFQDQIAAFSSFDTEYRAFAPAANADIQTTGQATYTGPARIGVSDPDPNAVGNQQVVGHGTSTITADFGTLAVTGSATDFVIGVSTEDGQVIDGTAKTASGTINFNGAKAASAAAVTGTLSGSITNEDYTLAVEGDGIEGAGGFRGDDGEFVRVSNRGGAGVTLDGTATAGGQVVLGGESADATGSDAPTVTGN